MTFSGEFSLDALLISVGKISIRVQNIDMQLQSNLNFNNYVTFDSRKVHNSNELQVQTL